jgi:hypothetical protein
MEKYLLLPALVHLFGRQADLHEAYMVIVIDPLPERHDDVLSRGLRSGPRHLMVSHLFANLEELPVSLNALQPFL